jgi:hypothetical protein
VTELMQASGVSTPAKSVLQQQSSGSGRAESAKLDFHLLEREQESGSSDEDAVEFQGAEAFRKKMEMKFN